jgi:hypothetical protein
MTVRFGYRGYRWGYLLLAGFVLVSCATGDVDDATPCSSDAECAPGICDSLSGECVDRTDTNNIPDAPKADAGSDQDGNDQVDLGSDVESSDMTTPVACVPSCAANEVCSMGACVSACDPACDGGATCTADGCQYPVCAAVGAACDPTTATQGAFTCADNGDGTGICLNSCAEEFSASSCGAEFYCIDVGETAPNLACVPSLCDVDADCGTDTCLNFDNGFGLCLPAGAKAAGAVCDASMSECGQGLYCRRNAANANPGVCTKLCDPFTVGSCGAGSFCGSFVTQREGLCSTNQSVSGTDAFDFCSPAGSWCADHVQCLSFDTFDGCIAYCRPGTSDCDGALLDGTPSVCNNYLYSGIRTQGACLPECDPLDVDPCGPGAVCVDTGPDAGICRTTCTAATRVADCCNNAATCNFQCVNGLCE